jgi:hypothetical protein
VGASPSRVEVPPDATITVTESGYTGAFSESDTCGGKATITPSTANGPSATFTVKAGSNGGVCTATFYDAALHSAQVTIGVTATTVTGSSKKRQQ